MKIVVSYVGYQDPYNLVKPDKPSGPILVALSKFEIAPDLVYLIYTNSMDTQNKISMKKHAEETKDFIEKEYLDTNVKCICLENSDESSPTDYAFLTRKTRESFDSIAQEYDEKDEFAILTSSGTPQMKAALVILRSKNNIRGTLYSLIEPGKDGADLTGRLEKVDISFYREIILLKQVKDLLNRYLYEEAATNMKTLQVLTNNDDRKYVYEIFSDIFSAYDAQKSSKQDYTKASDRLIRGLEGVKSENNQFLSKEDDEKLIKLIKDQINKLIVLNKNRKKKEDSNEFMFELYYTARKKFDIGLYITAFSVIWRVYEGFLRRKLKENKIKETDERILELKAKTNSKHLNIGILHEVLEQVDAELYKSLEEFGFTKEKYKHMRNDSLIGHGFKGTFEDPQEKKKTKEIVNTMLDNLKALISKQVDQKNFEQYPFNTDMKEVYREIIDHMILSIE